jgi:hypothetical protein
MTRDPELLTGVSMDELEALAAGILVPAAQGRLNHLLAAAKEHGLSVDEEAELDELLHQVDQLNLLKARAHYTIDRLSTKASTT